MLTTFSTRSLFLIGTRKSFAQILVFPKDIIIERFCGYVNKKKNGKILSFLHFFAVCWEPICVMITLVI